jgi:serine protease AprX
MTLSVVGGFRPGTLVGSAFGASFALARTELTATETAFEEDYWIAALEWADSLGADIVTSSLKFREVDTGVGYWWGDMDGATARVTQAAAVAERHGILVFQGAGNDGYNPLHNTLVAPADGIDVVAVGATTMRNTIARFSSCGPTTDPPMRIKPDLVAPGESVWVADVVHDSAYTHVSGTSLSTPLAAGVAALLVSVHRATPAQIRQVMRETASHAATPDVLWGWGMIDAVAAHRALLALFPTDAAWLPVSLQAPEFANPFRPHDAIAFALDAPARVSLRVYDVNGRRVRELLHAPAPAHGLRLRWDGTDTAGRPLPRGTYFVELRAASAAATRKLTLLR